MLLRLSLILSCLALPAMAQEPIRLQITFDAKAAAKIADAKEMVEVSTWYEGEPTPAGAPYISEIWLVYLGAETYQVFPRDQESAGFLASAAKRVGGFHGVEGRANQLSSRHSRKRKRARWSWT